MAPKSWLAVFSILASTQLLTAQGLQTSYDQRGLTSLSYNGVSLIDLNAGLGDAFYVGGYSLDGNGGWGGIGNTTTWNPSSQTLTWSWSWGSVSCQFVTPFGTSNLTVTCTVSNTSSQTLNGIDIYPFGLQFPRLPTQFGNASYPQFHNNLDAAPIIPADYGSGMVTMVDNDAKPSFLGFSPSGATNHYEVLLGTNNDSSEGFLATAVPVNRPIGPGQSDVYSLSLRFSPSGTDYHTLTGDIFTTYSQSWPQTLNWSDRRPIGELFMTNPASSPAPDTSPNPRNYTVASNINIQTADGRTSFQQAVLNYADNSVKILKNMNAQGAIVWDLEGQQYPQPNTSYVGDPTQLPNMAPEMDAIADQFFARFTSAGLRCGMTLRPQQLDFTVSPPNQTSVPVGTEAEVLLTKIRYAYNRWGCTIFYVDSDGGPDDATNPAMFQQVLAAMPQVLVIPENIWIKDSAYTAPLASFWAPYKPLHTTADEYALWPNAFTVTYIGDAPNDDLSNNPNEPNQWNEFVNAVAGGDILSFRAWFDDEPLNGQVTQIYQAAAALNGGPFKPKGSLIVSPATSGLTASGQQQFTAAVNGTTTQAVTWSMSPTGVGALSSGGLYTAPSSITTQQTVSVVATSTADPTKSASAALTLNPTVSISVTPTSGTLTAGQTLHLTATVTGSTNQQVNWTISPAGVGTVTSAGVYTAPASLTASQTVTVAASSLADNTKSATATITLNPSIAVSVSPTTDTLNPGQTLQLSATVTGTTNPQVNWSMSPAGAGRVSSAGVYTAPATVIAAQTVMVQATSVADTTKAAAATINLTPPAPTCPAAATNAFTGCYYLDQNFGASAGLGFSRTDSQINFNWGTSGAGSGVGPNSFSVRWQGNFTFTTGTYTFALSTDDGSILYIDGNPMINDWSDHPAYTVTQSVNLSAGTHLIQLDYYQNAGYASANLSWANTTPQVSVAVSPTTGTVTAGQTLPLTATVMGTTNNQVNWTVSPAGIGTVSSNGLYMAPASVAAPVSVTVGATSAADSTKSASAAVTVNPAPVVPTCPAAASNAFTGCYYADMNFGASAGLAFSRTDSEIKFNWGTDGPGSGVGPFNFCVRWQGNFTFAAGTYVFSLATDDGSILYIDGNPVINDWSDHPASTITQSVNLSAGIHLIRLDYYQDGGYASANLSWASTTPQISVTVDPQTPTVAAGQTLQLTATVTGTTNTQVNWTISPSGAGTVSSSGLYTAPASISSQQNVTVQATSAADSTKSGSASITVTPPAASGTCPAPSSNAFTGCYYLDQTFGSTKGLGFSRIDPQISFDWGSSGPGSEVGPNAFSVRWQGNFTFAAGTYMFNLATDDGSMLYVDGKPVISDWSDHAAYTITQPVVMSAGTHLIELDYYQAAGGATANLSWTSPAIGVTVTPNSVGMLSAGQTLQLTAAVAGTSNQQVNWTISPAGMGTVSASGLYTAPSAVNGQETVTATATSVVDTTKLARANITLSPTPGLASCPAAAVNAFTGCYYLDQTFGTTAGLAFTRTDPQISFNWTNSPGSGVGQDNFSVRWQGYFTFAAGMYTFSVATDDGSMLYIDGQPVLNEWGVHAAYTATQHVVMTAGQHLIQLDYFQAGGGASASLTWAQQ